MYLTFRMHFAFQVHRGLEHLILDEPFLGVWIFAKDLSQTLHAGLVQKAVFPFDQQRFESVVRFFGHLNLRQLSLNAFGQLTTHAKQRDLHRVDAAAERVGDF